MLLEQVNQNQNKVEIAWGKAELDKLKKNNLIYLMGTSPEKVQQGFIKNPMHGRIMEFLVFCFSDNVPDLQSPFFKQLTPVFKGTFYSISEYYIDTVLNGADYYALLDSIASELETRGYTVIKVIRDAKIQESEFLTSLGLPKITLDQPEFLDSFSSRYHDYMLLDFLPEGFLTTAWRLKNG